MKLAMNLLLWGSHISEQQFSLFQQIKNMGFEGVEIPVFEGTQEHFNRMSEAILSAGLECSVITCCGIETNPASADISTREASLEYLKWVVDISAILKAKSIVGPYYAAHGNFELEGTLAQARLRSAAVVKQMAQYAMQADIKLSIEFLNRFETRLLNTARDAADYVEAVDESNVGVLYDTHHANIEEASISKAFSEVGDSFNHIHFSESHRGICGSGLVDWNETRKALDHLAYDGWGAIEMFAHDVEGFSEMTHMWRPLCKNKIEDCGQSLAFVRALF